MRTVTFQSRPRIVSFADLLTEAAAYAAEAIQVSGSVRPTMLASTPRGLVVHYPKRMADEMDKDLFAIECRLLTVATEAKMCALVLESWITDTPGGQIPNCPPSQHPARREVVTIAAETRTDQRFLVLPIRRTTLGIFQSLGENEAPPGLTATGRFAQILRPKRPSRHQIEEAQLTLETIRVRFDLSPGPSTN